MRRLPVVLAVLGALVAPGAALAAPSITEFGGFTANRQPTGIAAGPDGNVWVTQFGGTGGIARLTSAGAVSEFTTGIPSGSEPTGIAAGPDGNLWFTLQKDPGRVANITPSGTVTTFTAGLTTNSLPTDIAAGPDGNLWFTQKSNPGRIGRITPQGVITEFGAGLTDKDPTSITAGPDGNLWYTLDKDPGAIGRITPSGSVTVFTAGLTGNSHPTDITAGPDGNLWFTEKSNPGRIGRITPQGVITEFGAGLTDKEPWNITTGADGNLWFTFQRDPGAIGRITPSGVVTTFQTGLTSNSRPTGITSGPDGAIWFTELADPGRVGRITVGPTIGATTVSGLGETTATLETTTEPNGEATDVQFEWGPTTSYGQITGKQTVPASAGSKLKTTVLTGLSPATTYHYRVVVTNPTATVTGPDRTFTTAAVPAPPPAPLVPTDPFTPVEPATPDAEPAPVAPPVIGRRVAATPAQGTVRVRVPGSNGFVSLEDAGALPVGTVIDTRRGHVSLTTALPRGRTQTATFWGGLFSVRQQRSSGQIRLKMPPATGCPRTSPARAGHSEDARRARRRPARRPTLWGKDKNGRYRTDGANSVATVRGTVWQTVERCDGTLTRVKEGAVLVRDLRLKKTVKVTAGRAYLARAPR